MGKKYCLVRCRLCRTPIRTKAQKEMYVKTLGFCSIECKEQAEETKQHIGDARKTTPILFCTKNSIRLIEAVKRK